MHGNIFKTLAAIASTAMLAAMLAACGSSGADTTESPVGFYLAEVGDAQALTWILPNDDFYLVEFDVSDSDKVLDMYYGKGATDPDSKTYDVSDATQYRLLAMPDAFTGSATLQASYDTAARTLDGTLDKRKTKDSGQSVNLTAHRRETLSDLRELGSDQIFEFEGSMQTAIGSDAYFVPGPMMQVYVDDDGSVSGIFPNGSEVCYFEGKASEIAGAVGIYSMAIKLEDDVECGANRGKSFRSVFSTWPGADPDVPEAAAALVSEDGTVGVTFMGVPSGPFLLG